MYLNIINNIKYESKRKSKKNDYSLMEEHSDKDNNSNQIINHSDNYFYYSVFYGDLTRNWIKLRH